MNYQIVTGSTGTSILLSFIEVYGNATPVAAATGPKYQHFDNTPRRVLGRQVIIQALEVFKPHITLF